MGEVPQRPGLELEEAWPGLSCESCAQVLCQELQHQARERKESAEETEAASSGQEEPKGQQADGGTEAEASGGQWW